MAVAGDLVLVAGKGPREIPDHWQPDLALRRCRRKWRCAVAPANPAGVRGEPCCISSCILHTQFGVLQRRAALHHAFTVAGGSQSVRAGHRPAWLGPWMIRRLRPEFSDPVGSFVQEGPQEFIAPKAGTPTMEWSVDSDGGGRADAAVEPDPTNIYGSGSRC